MEPSRAPEKRCMPCCEQCMLVTSTEWAGHAVFDLGISPGAMVVEYTAMMPPKDAAQQVVSGPPSGCSDTT